MPLTYPSKSKIGTSHQIELYQPMNSLTRSKNIEQLCKASWQRVAGKHDRVHGRQGFLTTIHSLTNVLSMILQEYNSIAAPRVSPQRRRIFRDLLQSCDSLGNPTIFISRM
jgi:hypothetical protein